MYWTLGSPTSSAALDKAEHRDSNDRQSRTRALIFIDVAVTRGTVSGITNSAGEHSTPFDNVARRGTAHGNTNSVGVVATLFADVNHVASEHCHADAAAALVIIMAAGTVANDHKLGRVALDEEVRHEALGVVMLIIFLV